MRLFILFLLATLLIVSQLNTILDVDLWWNLKGGEYIIKHLSIPRVDIFSYTLQDRLWIDHEWLSQVLMYFIFSHFGWFGLNLLKAIVVMLCFFILFFIGPKKENAFYSLYFLLCGILAFGYRSFLRPELFSYLLLCIFLYILEKTESERWWFLILLQILWVNLHGYFIIGPILVLLYSLGETISGNYQNGRSLFIISFILFLVSFINPYFYKGALYPIEVLKGIFGKNRLYLKSIHELMMPAYSGFRRYVFFWTFAILTSMTFIINLKRARLRHVFIFAIAFFASYIAVRNMPLFLFVGMPVASINMADAYPLRFATRKGKMIDLVTLFILCGILYFFVSNKYYIFTNQSGLRKTGTNFSYVFMPEGACNFLERYKLQGRIFNTIDFGPYIGYRFYPEKRIFIDTRTDLYEDRLYLLYLKAQHFPKVLDFLQRRYNFNIALIRHIFTDTEDIIKNLYKDPKWHLVYYDRNSVIFLRDIPEYTAVIRNFEIDFDKKRLVESDFNINVARFFEKIGRDEIAEKVYIRLLEENPKFLEAGNNLGVIYIESGRYSEAVDIIGRLLRYYPCSPELYANLGIVYLKMGREDGLRMLEKAARLSPYNPKLRRILKRLYGHQ